MPTLGEELRNRREQRLISLAEISEATRIGTRFLKAIETDNFAILPGGIFTRSFIRAYAKHVGMNEDDAIGLYLRQVAGGSVEPEPQSESAPSPPAAAEAPKRTPPPKLVVSKPVAPEPSRRFEPVTFRPSTPRTNWSTVVIGAGIVIFVVIIVFALVKQLNQGTSDTASQASSTPAKSTTPPKPASSNAQPAQQPAGAPAPPTATTPASPTQPASATVEAPSGQPLVVKLEASTGDVWVRYQVDDAKPTTLVLKQGTSQDLPPAQTHVTLNYGNRLTLKLKINNREANFPPDTPKFASQIVISRDNFQTFFQ